MAVMNDMLRSPPLSAHLSAQHGFSELAPPMYGRPRSRTAPPTPMVEAPAMEPAELEAIPAPRRKSHTAENKSGYFPSARTVTSRPDRVAYNDSVERSSSSPQLPTPSMPGFPRYGEGDFVRKPTNLHPPLDQIPRARTTSPPPGSHPSINPVFYPSEGATVKCQSELNLRQRSNSSSDMSQAWSSNSSRMSSFQTSSLGNFSSSTQMFTKSTPLERESEVALMEHIRSLRASHEIHLNSLKEAHEKEIASHRSYIAFLERRGSASSILQQPNKQILTVDTSQVGSTTLYSAVSANTIHSFESYFESQNRASQDLTVENEALKRKLSLSKKAVADCTEIRRERDQLRDGAERSERRISQLKDIVRKAKENEKVLKNMVSGLDSRLANANMERADVLEGFHDACETVQKLSEQERNLTRERDDLRAQLSTLNRSAILTMSPSVYSQDEENTGESQNIQGLYADCVPRRSLSDQLQKMQHDINEKDDKIRDLEQQLGRKSEGTQSRVSEDQKQPSNPVALHNQLEIYKSRLRNAEADRDRYSSLLQCEIRRQNRNAARAAVPTPLQTTPGDMLVENSDPTTGKNKSLTTQDDAARQSLEGELERCINEIVLYKLDIRGYKKDLKIANTRIAKLEADAARSQGPPTPESNSSSETRERARTEPSTQTRGPGLGIFVPETPRTPTRRSRGTSLVSPPSNASKSPQPPPRPSPLRPKRTPRTPIGLEKELPRLPSSANTPSPTVKPAASRQSQVLVQRAETLRSMSDSIISLYGKRSTPETVFDKTPSRNPISHPSSPAVASSAKAVPMAKFPSGILKTPIKFAKVSD